MSAAPDPAYPSAPAGSDAEAFAAREREAEVLDAALELVVEKLRALALVQDETGIRARRALEALEAPATPEPVHQITRALASLLVAVVYSAARGDRLRLARLLNDVLREAARFEGRAA